MKKKTIVQGDTLFLNIETGLLKPGGYEVQVIINNLDGQYKETHYVGLKIVEAVNKLSEERDNGQR